MGVPHFRLRIGGYLYDTNNDWSVGFNYVPSGGASEDSDRDQDLLQAWLDRIRAADGVDLLEGAPRALLSAAGRITYYRGSTVGADGKERSVAQLDLSEAIPGTGAAIHTPQTALTVSLLTNRPGGSYRGRFYWPALGGALAADGLLPIPTVQGYANQFATLVKRLGDLSNSGPSDGVPSIVSTTRNVATPITRLRVGNRLDVQRRRGNGQEERYGVAVVPQ